MKKVYKDIIISIVIGISLSYIVYLLKGGILYGDMYNQGIDFLEYYRNNVSIFGLGYDYNWSIALGDNMYSLGIYYLMSPFNIILILFKNIKMEIILPLFITIKFIFLIYFSSIYFEKVTSSKFKWYGAIFYAASYYILNYGAIQIMWLDTFIFLPLVLLGIEKILSDEDYKLYIIALFLLIITDYYLAALLVPHIAIYAIIRYIVINKDIKEIGLFIWIMIKKSLISVLLSSFVIVPAAVIMLSSAKETGVINDFGTSIWNVVSMLTQNYIGAVNQSSNTYITLIGIPILLSFLIFSKYKKEKLYLIHIVILIIALCIEKVNYILNFTYKPVGGDFRYNLFLNIYIAIYVYLFLNEVRKNNKLLTSFSAILLVSTVFILFNKDLVFSLKLTNLVCIFAYLLLILLAKRRFKFMTIVLSIFLLFEVSKQYGIVVESGEQVSQETRSQYSNVIDYIKDKYGEDKRIEIRGTQMSRNIFIANEANGVSAYHSLINGNYKNISKAFSNTVKDNVRIEFKGRNVIAQYIGTDYYVSSYNYCPYFNSGLIDKTNDFYIFEVDNKPFKFFKENSIIRGKLPSSMIEKDILLYSNLLIEENKNNIELDENLRDNFDIYPIEEIDTVIQETGEYYVTSKKEYGIEYIPFKVNGEHIGEDSNFPNINKEDMNENEIYIGKLNYGDILTIDEKYIGSVDLICIKENYIESSIEDMNDIEINNLVRDKKGLEAEISIDDNGYIVLPIVNDKYWKIKVDNKTVQPIEVNGGFMALKLENGNHSLDMNYKFYYKDIGIIISLATIIVVIMSSKADLSKVRKNKMR